MLIQLERFKKYTTFLYYRLGSRTGYIFYISLGINILLLLLLLAGVFVSRKNDLLQLNRSQYTSDTIVQNETAVTQAGDTCDAQVNEILQLFAQASQSPIKAKDDKDAELLVAARPASIPEFEFMPKADGINYPADLIKITTINNMPNELAYKDADGNSPLLSDMIKQYRLRARNFQLSGDTLWETITLLKVANIYILLAMPDKVIDVLQDIEENLGSADEDCSIQGSLDQQVKNLVSKNQNPDLSLRLELERARRSCSLIAGFYQSYGRYYSLVSEPQKSIESFDKSVFYFDALTTESPNTFIALAQKADILASVGKLDEARGNLNNAISAFQDVRFASYLPMAYVNSINLEIQNGGITNIQILWDNARNIFPDTTDGFSRALLVFGFAEYLRIGGKPKESVPLYIRALSYFEKHQFVLGQAYAKVSLAQAEIASSGDPARVTELLQESEEIFTRAKHEYGLAVVFVVNSQVAFQEKDTSKSLAYLQEAKGFVTGGKYPPLEQAIDKLITKQQ